MVFDRASVNVVFQV